MAQAEAFFYGLYRQGRTNVRSIVEETIGWFDKYLGSNSVTLSLPAIIGRNGLVQVLEPEMTDDERKALEYSAERLRQAVSRCVGGTPVEW